MCDRRRSERRLELDKKVPGLKMVPNRRGPNFYGIFFFLCIRGGKKSGGISGGGGETRRSALSGKASPVRDFASLET